MEGLEHLQKICIFLTRRCNMRCRGCNVINYQSAYEMSTDEWKKAFDIFKDYGIGFVVIFGGEPTLRNDLPELIEYLNHIDMAHTVITNSLRLLKDENYYKRVLASEPYGLTVSINAPVTDKSSRFHDELKTQYGWRLLEKLLNDQYEGDLVGNMMVTRKNIEQMPLMVETLTNMDVWSIMTFIHLCDPHESMYWWYRGPITEENKELMFTRKDIPLVKKIGNWLADNYDRLKIHNSITCLRNWELGVTQDWHCKYLTYPAVNPDGSLMACVDRPLTRPINIFDLPTKEKELEESFAETIRGCHCFWDHEFDANLYIERNMRTEGIKIFQHKRRANI